MCIIAIKPKDIDLPSKEYLENCFINNDDGAGFMYTENNKVKIYKGYMTLTLFINQYYRKSKSQLQQYYILELLLMAVFQKRIVILFLYLIM